MKKKVITLSRQFGSGGSEIGKKLAKIIEIPYVDKTILQEAAEKSGISKEHFEKADERRTNSFLFSLVSSHYAGSGAAVQLNDIITDDKLFIYTADAIKRIAKEPCLIVGRCADDILDGDDIIKIFVYADLEEREKRVAKLYDISEKAASTLIRKTDKKRANYYNFNTSKTWGAAENYDLCINTSKMSYEDNLAVLVEYINKRNTSNKF